MAQVRESFGEQTDRLRFKDGVVYGVKLIGNESINGRRYSNDVIAEGIHRYSGKHVFINHPPRNAMAEDRDFHEWVGVIEKPVAKEGGGFGNVRLCQESPHYKRIVEAIEKFPTRWGFSHVADIDSVKRDGVESVSKIKEVFSVDIVTDPATTAGAFESKGLGMKKLTIKQVLESTKSAKSWRRNVVAEMVGGGMVPDTTEVNAEAGADSETQIKAGILAAINSRLEAANSDQLAKVLKGLDMGDSISKLVAGEPQQAGGEAPPADAPTPEKPAAEGKPADKPADAPKDDMKEEVEKIKAESALLRAGREATDVQILAVARVPESSRKALIESFPKLVAESNQRPPRPNASPAATDQSGPSAAYEAKFEARTKAAREAIANRGRQVA